MNGYRHNSTIRIKNKICKRCGLPKPIFSRGRCVDCARIEDALSRMEEDSDVTIKEDGLQELIKDADKIFSQWVRLQGADSKGICKCYTCGKKNHWLKMQCGHYIKRGNLFLRFDPRNCRIQCVNCNVFLDGNYAEFSKRLEIERPGIVEYLLEESRLVYKPTRDEISGVIKEYSSKLKQIQK